MFSWRNYIDEHCPPLDDEICNVFLPPATRSDIAQWEDAAGIKMPTDLFEFYMEMNGCRLVTANAVGLLPIAHAIQIRDEILAATDLDYYKHSIEHAIPVMELLGNGDMRCIAIGEHETFSRGDLVLYNHEAFECRALPNSDFSSFVLEYLKTAWAG